MKVLWFSVTASLFSPFSNVHNGGGWISSLEKIVKQNEKIDLGVAFYWDSPFKSHCKDGVRYYTLPNDRRNSLVRFIKPESDKTRIERYLDVIKDFKPDLIQIFGSENDFGLICDKTEIPVVIHMQGSMPPYYNALFPAGFNRWDFLFSKGLTLRRRFMGWRSVPNFRHKAEREERILKNCHYYMGRTEWDKNLINLYNPSAEYYHCEEALRDSFVENDEYCKYASTDQFIIISIISNPWYKGADLILKTAKLLRENRNFDFEWHIYGVNDIKFFEEKVGIKASDVNVIVKGRVGKELLVKALCSSSVYVHPSYIDNSPNSLCEAQYLGVPVIATNVGGISSLISDSETGLLVPANDPFTLANKILSLRDNPNMAKKMGESARNIALRRHNPEIIGKTLFNIYKSILEK